MKILVTLVGLSALSPFANAAFNAQQFFNYYCSNIDSFTVSCSGFQLSSSEKTAFQNENFLISNAINIQISSCNLGIFNENFVNKFPNASNMTIKYCNLQLNNEHTTISKINYALRSLSFLDFNSITGSANVSSFKYLTSLGELRMENNYLTNFAIEKTTLANTNLQVLKVIGSNLNVIHPEAFKTLNNLRVLNISGAGLTSLPAGLLDNNRRLSIVGFSDNKIETIPAKFFPASVEQIELNKNKLQVFSAQVLKKLSFLIYLDLSQNSISVFSSDALGPCLYLEYVDLRNNLIAEFKRSTFENCKNLESVYLTNNKYTSLPQDIFDDLPNLEVAVVNPTNYYG